MYRCVSFVVFNVSMCVICLMLNVRHLLEMCHLLNVRHLLNMCHLLNRCYLLNVVDVSILNVFACIMAIYRRKRYHGFYIYAAYSGE